MEVGSPIPPVWILLCGGFAVVVSGLSVLFDWSPGVAVLAVLPGLIGIEAGRIKGLRRRGLASAREAPKPTWGDLAVPFVPILLLCLAFSFVFETTRWSWLAPAIALMTGGLVVAEHLAWRRTSETNRA
jgi:uncharacterized membrane protein HdeD (DUF308 family)